jgi:hypothetical protein
MTEYKIALLFDQMYSSAGGLMSSAMALFGGVLVASNVAEHRLSLTRVILSVGRRPNRSTPPDTALAPRSAKSPKGQVSV